MIEENSQVKFQTKIYKNLLVQKVNTTVSVEDDKSQAHKVLLIKQFTVNYAGGERFLCGASLRFDDIGNVEYGSRKVLTSLYMQILSGMLNCFIIAQLIMQAQLDFGNYFGVNPIRTVIAIGLALFGLCWAYEWAKMQFIDGYKTLVITSSNGENRCEILYDEGLENLILEARKHDKCTE